MILSISWFVCIKFLWCREHFPFAMHHETPSLTTKCVIGVFQQKKEGNQHQQAKVSKFFIVPCHICFNFLILSKADRTENFVILLLPCR